MEKSNSTRRRSRVRWVGACVIICVVIVAIAVGVAVGVKSHRESAVSVAASDTGTSTPKITTTATPSSSSTSTTSSTKTKTATSSISAAATPTATNPVKLASKPIFLGNVTSSNTPDVRDLGFSGQIGNTTILTFGDTIPCKQYQIGCVGLEAPNSAGMITNSDGVLNYTDINVNKGGHAQIFCPLVDEESDSWGLGLSNVLETGEDQGIVFFTRNNRSGSHGEILGSGVAFVNTSSGKPVCSRPNVQWWEANEPYFGDHNAILSPHDNYIYTYGGYLANTSLGNAVYLARVPKSSAGDLSSYTYWNGTAFTSIRLTDPTLSAAVFTSGQGSIWSSVYYDKFLYFKPSCPGGACITVMAADEPWGPWGDDTVQIWGSGDSPDGYEMYAPAVQAQWSGEDGRWVVLIYTGRGKGFGNILQAINVTFA